MMKKYWIRTAGVFFLAAIMCAGLDAQPMRQGRPFCPGRAYGPGYFQRSLPLLTDEQKEQVEASKVEQFKEMKPLRNQLAELRAKERTLLSEEEVNMKEVDAVIDLQSELTNKIRKAQVAHRVKMKEILTEEQRMQLERRRNSAGKWKGWRYDCPRFPRWDRAF